ncbi:MAG TPA: acyltransferase family protein [Burkholderiales bacterium]|nr:acyltransferase family protein [Burkholderiales bacterium]
MERRHDIDALRALAFALLILYHVGMFYVAGWPWHVKSAWTAEWLHWPMRFLNLWRMDLLFVVSGVALSFLARGRTTGELLRLRSLRLLLPLAFGMAAVVPFQAYAEGVSRGLVDPGFGRFLLHYYAGGPWPRHAFAGSEFGMTWNHLWYLPYLWAYTAVLLAARRLLAPLGAGFLRLRGAALLFLPALPFVLYALALRRFPPTHDLVHDWHLHAAYFTLFAFGWWMGQDAGIWAEARRLRHVALAAALGSFALLAFDRDFVFTRNLYLWSMVLAVLGYARAHLDRPSRWLAWANESIYPWYVLHQTFIVALGFSLAPLALGPVAEPALVLGGTVLGCWLLTDGAVRRIDWLRPLFGLKPKGGAPRVAQVLRWG